MFAYPPLHNRVWYRAALGIIIGVAVLGQCIGAWSDSQTTDEAAHIGAGYSYWRTGDFRLNPEHPPLVKLLASAPLLALPPLKFETNSQAWQESNQWIIGAELVYGSHASLQGARLIMFLARLPMILVWATLGWLIWYWSRQRWGDWAGLLTLSIYGLDPNWLGHGHLVTTDVAVALGYFATVWALNQLFRRPTWRWIILVGVIFSLTQLTKFSALMLWLIVPFVGLIRLLQPEDSRWNWKWFGRLMAALLIISGCFTWFAYGFEIKPIEAQPRIESLWAERSWLASRGELDGQSGLLPWLVTVTDPGRSSGRWLAEIANLPIPAFTYLRGALSTLTHSFVGHEAYLYGQSSWTGWWWYFPVTILFKTPIVTLGLGVLAMGLAIWQLLRKRQLRFDTWLFIIPPALFFLWSLSSHINIGLRHVFPIYPFLFMSLGSLAARWPRWNHMRPIILGLGVIGILVTSIRAWPHTIGYFNAFAGGTEQGHRILLDSNLDWNQDIWRLRAWLDDARLPEVRLALFGSIPYHRVFPEAQSVLTDSEIAAGIKPSGIVVISAGQLFNPPGPFGWLRQHQPIRRIGSSIWIFDFR